MNGSRPTSNALAHALRPLPPLAGALVALSAAPLGAAPIVLEDVTDASRIAFRHTDGASGQHYIVEYVSAGLAVFDYDADGDDDIYFLNGAAQPGIRIDPPPRNELWRNDGNWAFTDVTAQAGVGDTGHGLAVVAGDYDNDGDLDLYLNNCGPNVLYRNNGDGTFTDVTAAAGVANGNRVGAGTCFLDADGDGDLDLFVSNYIKFSYADQVVRTRLGHPVYPSPRDYPPDPDTFYRNNGDGTFADASAASGIAAQAGPGMGPVCADYDADGDTDILVGNDVEANFLYRNDGRGRFDEVALEAGIAYDFGGLEQGSMGAEAGDYDNDGWIDFHITSYQQELATLYRNLGSGMFEDVTLPTGAGAGTRHHVTWGNSLADLDNDGHRDLFIACGHLNDLVDQYDDTTSFRARNVLLHNTGSGRFEPVPPGSGTGLDVVASSRGTGLADFDNDGDLDIVILNMRDRPTLLRNDTPHGNHWLQVDLRGRGRNLFGVGAQVRVTAGELLLVDEVHAGRGYQSHYGLRLHFGLGHHERADAIEVRWIGGGAEVFAAVPADQRVVLHEGAGRTAETSLSPGP